MQSLTTTIQPVSRFEGLEAVWRGLEQTYSRPFFLSWDWAAAAIETAGADLLVADVASPDGVIALGLFAPVIERRYGLFRARQLRLHETGNHAGDTVPIELNSLLVAPEFEIPAWRSLLAALESARFPRWDEIIVTNARAELEAKLSAEGARIHRRAETGSGFVDLAGLRARGVSSAPDYIATLGKSTRTQLKRSFRLYEERGPLAVEHASTPEEAFDILDDIAALHDQKWHARGEHGVGDARNMMKFHRRLIERTIGYNSVELVRISAGGEPFACIYNFVDGDSVLFNIGGFKIEKDNRLKPGLVAHTLLIELHLRSGKNIYDFLAGDDRYKLSLGQPGPDFVSFAVQRDTPMIRMESVLRSVKTRLFK